MRWCSNKCVTLHGKRRHGGRSGKGRRKEGRIKGGRRERVTNVGAGGEGVMKSRASYVGTSAQPCSTCEVTTPWMSTISCFTPPPALPHPSLPDAKTSLQRENTEHWRGRRLGLKAHLQIWICIGPLWRRKATYPQIEKLLRSHAFLVRIL